jgi:hypothetical protein
VEPPIFLPGTPDKPPGTVWPPLDPPPAPVDPGGSIEAEAWAMVFIPGYGWKYVVLNPGKPEAGPKK